MIITIKNMKKMMLTLMLLCTFALNASSQEIYKEVKRIMQKQEAIKNDTGKSLDERKIAAFKWDAIYYMIMKAGDNNEFTPYDLGMQTSSMIDFVNLYVKRLSEEKKKTQKDLIMSRYKNTTIQNALFNDMDKDIIYAYVDNDKYITQFSLDTNWVKALEEVRKNNW